jgi:hypothetical protein
LEISSQPGRKIKIAPGGWVPNVDFERYKIQIQDTQDTYTRHKYKYKIQIKDTQDTRYTRYNIQIQNTQDTSTITNF